MSDRQRRRQERQADQEDQVVSQNHPIALAGFLWRSLVKGHREVGDRQRHHGRTGQEGQADRQLQQQEPLAERDASEVSNEWLREWRAINEEAARLERVESGIVPAPPCNNEGRCEFCGQPAPIPFELCWFCGDSPAYHHGRCCRQRPRPKPYPKPRTRWAIEGPGAPGGPPVPAPGTPDGA